MNSELTEKTDTRESQPQRFATSLPGTPRPALPRLTDRESAGSFRGWILYDGDCPSCTASARRFDRIFRRRGFLFLPLQTKWVMPQLGLEPGVPPKEMHVLTSAGQDIAGANAIIFLARQIWWAWPVVAFAKLPGMHGLLDRSYRWMAAHRSCDPVACEVDKGRSNGRQLFRFGNLHPFLRKLVWVYGLFIVMVIIAFVILTFRHADQMAAREPVARSLCLFITIFWGARLFVQFAIFDPRPFPTNWIYRVGYHALTFTFAFLVLVYGKAAL